MLPNIVRPFCGFGIQKELFRVIILFFCLFMLFLISCFYYWTAMIWHKNNRFKVIRTEILNEKQALALRKSEDDYDFWRPIKSGFSTDVFISPSLMKSINQTLKKFNINHSIVIENVQNLIKVQNSRTHQPGYNGKINFNEYYSHDDVSLCIWLIYF